MSVEIKLPKDWESVPLGNVCKLKNGFAFKSNEYKSEGVPVIRISDIKDGLIVPRNTVRVSEKSIYKDYIISSDEILVAMSGATTGKFGIFKSNEVSYQNQRVGKFNILDESKLDNNFLLHQLHSLKRQIEKDAYGGAQPNISSKKIEEMLIVLPPLKTQQLVVSKIEELFSELDKGIENLKTAQQQLKTYRQSILKWAFEGKLTEEWRKKQKKAVNRESLIKQLSEEREKQAKLFGLKLKPLPLIEAQELLELEKLPAEFAWIRLGNLLWSVKDGPHYSPKYETIGIPFISGGNIRPDGIDFGKAKFISKELHEELSKRCKPEKWDVLYTKGGTTGIAKVNTYDIEFNVWVHVAVLKTLNSINPFYLQHALNSTHCYKQSQKYTHGVGNQDLGLTRMILITLPICSLKEQEQILQEIENRLGVADKMEESINQSLQQAEALRQSILKKAFEGKLI